MRLVRTVDLVLDTLEADPSFAFFMLDGQTIVLEDYLDIRPENRARLERLARTGRILIGPWYLQPDEFLVGAESLVRNLQTGRRMGAAFGGVMPVGYVPDTFGHIAQLPQILRGFGLMLAIVPITNVALGTLPAETLKNASGLFNLTRNLGGAVGLAILNTALNDRIDLHLARLHESVNWARGPAVETLNNLTHRFAGSDAQLMALKQMMGLARRQASVMSFADVFLILTVLFALLAVAGVTMKRPAPVAAGAGGH